ncbi:MAG: DNA-directed RNA polymerase, subunit E'' [DPANN group archaeon]|nr:DNA-directed RNA polymerase, subunit E'' [DPANN group archaeon]
MVKKACKTCGALVMKDICPTCHDSKLTENWKGRVIVIEPENSDIAKKMGIKKKGEYAIRK